MISPKDVIVLYKCPECGYIHKFALDNSPGDTFWICDECDPTDETVANYPELIGAEIKEGKKQ